MTPHLSYKSFRLVQDSCSFVQRALSNFRAISFLDTINGRWQRMMSYQWLAQFSRMQIRLEGKLDRRSHDGKNCGRSRGKGELLDQLFVIFFIFK